MSDIAFAGSSTALPEVGLLGSSDRPPETRAAERSLRLAYLPGLISVSVHALFLVAYWVPELVGFPGHLALLTQLAPMVSAGLTSESTPVVAAQADRSGVGGGYLLLAGLAIPLLAHSRYWVARLAVWVLTYVGAVFVIVIVLGLLVRGEFTHSLLSVIGLLTWLFAAAVTSWRSLWVDLRTLPTRPRGLWPLLAFMVLNPLPVAVGRRLFASDLRVAATQVLGGGFSIEWAALITPSTFPVFLSGLAVGALVWSLYALLPPSAVPRRRAMVALGASVVLTATTGAWAGHAAAQRADQLRMGSPADDIRFSCGASVQRRSGRPAVTLAASGANCTTLTAYSGYREMARRRVASSVSPVAVFTPEGQVVSTRFVSAPYGGVLVIAGTDRIDDRATVVSGYRYADGVQLWTFACPGGAPMGLRFTGSSAGDSLLAGRITVAGEGSTVLVACNGPSRRLDPRTGRG